jgi:hypothetical protein
MRKRSIIQLTPLLDVVLLLLFALMIQLSVKDAAQTEAYDVANNDLAIAEQEKNVLADEVNDLTIQLASLTQQLDEKGEEIALLQESNDEVLYGLARFLDMNNTEISLLLSSANAFTAYEKMSELSDPTKAAEALYNYESLSQKFYFIDVTLASQTNQLLINGNQSTVHVVYDADASPETIAYVKENIKQAIESAIQTREGGSSMIMILLQTGDDDVYHYAWRLVWESIGELEQKYGTDKLHRLGIPWTQSNERKN